LSRAELKKMSVIEKVIHKHLAVKEAAEILELSTRQFLRLKKRYLAGGPQEIPHKNRGRTPAHALTDTLKDQVVNLYRDTYYNSNNTHYSELLEERESIKLSASSVRRILLEKGVKINRSRRGKKTHKPRDRKAQAGMLWQIDASSHAWLEDRSPEFTLLGAIDDATGQVVGATFRLTETREGYFAVMRQGIEAYGIPLGLYSDRHTIFRSPNEELTVEQELAGKSKPLSQFGKAMEELQITHIKAMTPEAKGRIERLWGTFQDRLIIELRLLGVSTLEDANRALPQLIAKHNHKFSVLPENDTSAYCPLSDDIDLTYVFTVRESRRIGSGQTLSYGGKLYTTVAIIQRFETGTLVEVRQTPQGEVVIFRQGKAIALRETEKPMHRAQLKPEKKEAASPSKPTGDHPWKSTDRDASKKTVKRGKNTNQDFKDAMYSQHDSYAEGLW